MKHDLAQATGQSVTLTGVTKFWGDTQSLRGIDLSIPAGKFTAILGPSGCGKSTTLRAIAGLETVTDGAVWIGDREVTALPPAKRNLSMVFQNYALFPHLSVAENIIFGLKVERLPSAERKKRLGEVAELLELTPYLDRKPAALSGGQQQRVALGRAVISRRPVCLMDEPLSNLDARLRDEMRREIRRLQQALGFTMVYVTHDQTEAITMADQVVLMNEGRIEQVAAPQDIYRRPATPFAARFIGTPPMNLLPARAFVGRPDGIPDSLLIGIRPEVLSLCDTGPLAAVVKAVEFLGADTLLELSTGAHAFLAKLPGARRFAPGDALRLSARPEDIHLFDTNTAARVEDPALASLFAQSAT
ncbi:sn-glycerol-3-phosphate import ATP-binding protein UgpC [Tritonibacter multivorans]|uniref:sn-glycerol-3-phosphate import ATP-binding protein UgpC n=1 Tax=Tritonibacter multivorans TaxID=928856 RepID=A0A0P1GHI0_9RHOB|nr:ABC transporter ATP-binding protein [Tritonibacter multivorans]MDA7420667.1 ABC transporter ATP-binding protein [Tritonibacter multivorans]CUH81165.1 sn-glycerol-3-phosphate import ATP-binding protein UgpC [Tritonibacter multivorans]SFC29801.1 carbohydrate ABC transporter ATP-binding protein, CUT1 family [Tritonibacter multivorans]